VVEGQIPIEDYKTGNTDHSWDLVKLRNAHTIKATFAYKKSEVNKGYANRTLYINLTKGEIKEKPVTDEMKKKFTGGRGFGLKLLWDSIKPTTRWDSDENELLVTTGPLCGTTQYAGSGKSLCLSISPATNIICDCNVGGFFGPYLKFAGFDALEIQGKATEDSIIVIDGEQGIVTVEAAPLEEINTHLLNEQLTHMYATKDTDKCRQKVSVISSGIAADHS